MDLDRKIPEKSDVTLSFVEGCRARARVGAQSGLGPGPGWGPYGPIYGAIWAHIWAHVGPYGPSWTGLGEGVNFPSTFRRDIWTNLVRLGSKTHFLMKFLNDSTSFLLEKLKNQVILTKNPNM